MKRYDELRVIKTPRASEVVQHRNEAGDKWCLRCGLWKPVTKFYHASHTSDRLQPDCKECILWRNTKRMFSLDRVDYEVILNEQGGVCAICKRPESKGEASWRLAVDHDHSCCPGQSAACGECNRGLLCSNCNLSLGVVHDSIEILQGMIEYLRKWESTKGEK